MTAYELNAPQMRAAETLCTDLLTSAPDLIQVPNLSSKTPPQPYFYRGGEVWDSLRSVEADATLYLWVGATNCMEPLSPPLPYFYLGHATLSCAQPILGRNPETSKREP